MCVSKEIMTAGEGEINICKDGVKPPAKIVGLAKTLPLYTVNFVALALGFLQQLAVVKCHGTSAISDFYFLLIVVPQIIFNLSNSVTNNALLPFMVHRRERLGDGDEGALIGFFETRARRIAVFLALISLGIGITQAAFAQAWNTARLDVLTMLISAPFLIIYGVINSLYATTLQSRRQFWPAIAGSLFYPFFGLLFGLALASFGAWPFVAGQSIGMFLQYLWLKKRMRSSLPTQREKEITLKAEENSEVRSKVMTLLLIGLGFQCLPFIDRTVAQKAGTGSVAAIALASRLGNSVSPLILSATAMMLFTTFAELAAAGNSKGAVVKLLQVLETLQWLLAAGVLLGPFVLGKLLPLILSQQKTVESILHVFPDYLLAGCVSATGMLTIACYYSVFKDFRFQLYAVYSSLAVYALVLCAPSWTPVKFGIRVISMANVANSVLSVLGVTLYLAISRGRIFPWRYLVSFIGLLSAWIIVRNFY
jgi:peptidoglycan biosynthesis protein MviN/MurJ (putative lipid II flippase)